MVEIGTSVARRSPLPSAAEVRQWVGDRVDGLLTTLLSEGLRADAFLLVTPAGALGVLTRRGDLYVLAARDEALRPLEGRTFLSAEEARVAAAACGGGGEVGLQPVWFS